MVKKAEIFLEYQNLIPQAPVAPQHLISQAASNDGATVRAWRAKWVDQTKRNKERFGSFKDHGIGQLHGAHQYMPAIVAGSGPSLAGNVEKLKDRGKIPLISCLHNFHFMEDHDVKADYYVSLDAGSVVLDEVAEGGKLTPDEYWARTADHTLLAFTGSPPELLEKWRGRILFFTCPVPDREVALEIEAIERFSGASVITGGNVLGACLYIAKAVLGCAGIAFVGADFCFSYDHKFHGWNSKYDANIGQCVPLTDVYGIKRKTWPTYANFKAWFDYIATTVPGTYYNCSEGGCLGSYPEGNIEAFKYMDLEVFLGRYNAYLHTKACFENPDTDRVTLLFN